MPPPNAEGWPEGTTARTLVQRERHVTDANGQPKVKVEIVLGDDMVERAVDAIRKAAQTGRIGDGKIFVSNIEEAVRIRRTGT